MCVRVVGGGGGGGGGVEAFVQITTFEFPPLGLHAAGSRRLFWGMTQLLGVLYLTKRNQQHSDIIMLVFFFPIQERKYTLYKKTETEDGKIAFFEQGQPVNLV